MKIQNIDVYFCIYSCSITPYYTGLYGSLMYIYLCNQCLSPLTL